MRPLRKCVAIIGNEKRRFTMSTVIDGKTVDLNTKAGRAYWRKRAVEPSWKAKP